MRATRLLPGLLAGLAVLMPPAPAIAQTPVPQCRVLGTPCKLSVGLDDAQVLNSEPAPNGQRVVFAHQTLNGPEELYTVPIHGGSPVLLSPPGEHATFHAFTPDSARVLYTQSDGSGTRLYSVPAAGPASARVRLADDVGVQPQIAISPDSVKVVFLPPSRDRLRVVPAAGPASAGQRLTAPFVPGGTAGGARISADSRSVVYRADQETAGVFQLYRVPLTLTPAPAPPTTRLNRPLVAGGDVSEFMLSPGDGTAVYRADQDTDSVRELYRVRLGGGENVKLNPPLPPGWEVRPPGELGSDGPATISPDDRRVLFETAFNFGGWAFSELYSAPTSGATRAAVRIDEPSLIGPDGGRIATVQYKISADSRRVVYTLAHKTSADAPTTNWLLSVPIAGPADAGRLLTFPNPEEFVFELSRDSRRVVYLIGNALFSGPIAGGTGVQLDGAEDPSGIMHAGTTHLVYRARLALRTGLFSVPADGSAVRRDLTASLGSTTLIFRPTLTADGDTVVYTAQRSPSANLELFSSRLAPVVVPPQG